MKRFFSLLMMFVALTSMSMRAVVIDEITEENNGYHPYKVVENYAEYNTFWSIYLDAGFSHFNGDRGARLWGEYAKYAYSPDFGIGVEYSFTPCWGVWVDYHMTTYGQHMFDKTIDYGYTNNDRFMGQLNTLGTGFSYNLLSGFFPRRTTTWINLYLQFGGGLGVYSLHGAGFDYKTVGSDGDMIILNPTNITDALGNIVGAWYDANHDRWTVADGVTDYSIKHYNTAAYLHLGFLLQFNLTRSLELGLRPYYDFFTSDRLDGNTNLLNPNNKMNDGIIGLDVQVRWAIGAKKDSHTRNYADVHKFDEGIAMRNENKTHKNLQGRLDSLENALDSLKNLPLIANNGGDTIINNGAAGANGSNAAWEDIYFVYFPNDVYELDDEGHIRVQEMAERLNMWPEACLQLTGYADATSTSQHNEWLSWNRSQAVRSELINLYNIEPERLIDLGCGQLDNVPGAFRANRRVTMKLVPKEQVDSLRQLRDEAHENFRKNNPEANGDRKQSARTQALNDNTAKATNTPYRVTPYGVEEKKPAELKEDIVVTVKSGENLGILAYKYYRKASCWIYIYEANKDVLSSPADLKPGMKLTIPALTEEQKAQTGHLLQKFKQ